MKRNLFLLMSLLLISAMFLSACPAVVPVEQPAAEPPAAEQPAAEEPPAAEQPTTEEPAEPEAPEEEVAEMPAEFDWRMFEGETLRVAMVTQPWSQFLEPYIGEFEELTGIDVTYEILPEDQFRQKTTIEFAAGTSDVDVFLSMVAQEGIKYESAGWYADLAEFLDNPAITDPDFDFADFTESSLSIATLPNGKLIGLPVYTEFGALFYNKDLFDAAGVPYPPTTIEEVEAAAQAIHDPDNGIYGFVGRGKGAAATSQFSSLMHAFGSEWVDADGNANVLDPKFTDAIDWYSSLLRNYGPEGTTSYSWQQGQDVFLQGKAGMWLDASVFFANLVDPEQSTVVDTVGVTMAPAAEDRTPYVGGWHLSTYEGSPKKDAAWLFIQWALGKDMVKRAQLENITTGRTSAWNSEEYQAQNQYPELAEVFLEAMTIGDPRWNPPVLAVSEARDAVGNVIVLGIEGEDFMPEAEKANEVLQRLLDDTPKLEAYP